MQKLVGLANPQQKENLKYGHLLMLQGGVCDVLLPAGQVKWVNQKRNNYGKKI
jgi:hypothetical protein